MQRLSLVKTVVFIDTRDTKSTSIWRIQIVPVFMYQKTGMQENHRKHCCVCSAVHRIICYILFPGEKSQGNYGFKAENINMQHPSEMVTDSIIVHGSYVAKVVFVRICLLINGSCTSKQSTIQQVHVMQQLLRVHQWFVYKFLHKTKWLLTRKLCFTGSTSKIFLLRIEDSDRSLYHMSVPYQ